MTVLADLIRETGVARGLVAIGICDARPFSDVRAALEERRVEGRAGRLRFTYSDPETSTDVRRSFPWAERLVVGALTYLPAGGDPGPSLPNHGRIARFATEDHYQPLRAALTSIVGVLARAGYRAQVLVDDNRLVDRAAAVRAGIAWWGKSTMVLMPRFGPWTLLGSVVTDAPLPTSSVMQRDCGTCTDCLPACPTGALDCAGKLDATRCISYWAQMPGSIPRPIRVVWGDRLYGCDDCLHSCPPGKRWLELAEQGVGRVDLLDVLECSDERLRDRFAHFYVPRNDTAFLRRNALVALGHSGGSGAVPVLAGYLDHARPVLREHAAWALGRIGGSDAQTALAQAVRRETEATVRAELDLALGH